MTIGARQTEFVLGALLLAGGWGTTGYVEARQAADAADRDTSIATWVGGRGAPYVSAGQTLCTLGALGMAAGAAVVVLAFPEQVAEAVTFPPSQGSKS